MPAGHAGMVPMQPEYEGWEPAFLISSSGTHTEQASFPDFW